jgi:transcriptional regulator with XRE-family HTH domain
MEPKLAITLRAKKLGILIRDARLEADKSLKVCGESIGATGGRISSFERGTKSPSLPEIELLSYYLNVPISRFWKDEIKSTDLTITDNIHIEHALILRDRYVGKILKETRIKEKISYKDIHEKTGITPAKMKKYEEGESPVSLPELEFLCSTLNLNITDFIDPDSEIGGWIISQDKIEEFLRLPLNLQDFVSKPVNQPYLEIAQRLSKISAEELRAIAEGLLEITI